MALFFDQGWFDARLAALGLTRKEIALALGLMPEQVDEIWKDQRELTARDVQSLAQLLAASVQEIATHAGVSTPVPKPSGLELLTTRVDEIAERLDRLEARVAEIAVRLEREKR